MCGPSLIACYVDCSLWFHDRHVFIFHRSSSEGWAPLRIPCLFSMSWESNSSNRWMLPQQQPSTQTSCLWVSTCVPWSRLFANSRPRYRYRAHIQHVLSIGCSVTSEHKLRTRRFLIIRTPPPSGPKNKNINKFGILSGTKGRREFYTVLYKVIMPLNQCFLPWHSVKYVQLINTKWLNIKIHMFVQESRYISVW